MRLSKRASGIIVGIILLGLGVGIGVLLTQQSAPAELLADPAQAQTVVDPNRADEVPEVSVQDEIQPVEAQSSPIAEDEANVQAAAQDGASITAEEAKDIAEKAFDGAKAVELELERENGGLVYEVELDNGAEVEIDAATGDILEIEQYDDDAGEVEDNDDDDVSLAPQEESGISPDQAREIAEKAVGSGAKAVELELERENGGIVYEVELDNGFEVEIDADTGDVLEIEQDDD